MSMKPVHFFPSCLVNEAYPEVGFSVARLLERRGIRLVPPKMPLCCGQPAFNAGFMDDSRRVARATLAAYAEGDGVVLVPSGSCADMLKHHLPTLFAAGSAERAEADRLSGRVRELSQYLVDDLGAVDFGAALEAGVAYHPSCHLSRGLGVKDQPLRLLKAVKGLRLLPFPASDECCGFGGSFSVTHDELSGAMLESKARSLQSVKPDYVVSCDLGCLMHLEGGFRRRGWKVKVRHLAQFLAEAL